MELNGLTSSEGVDGRVQDEPTFTDSWSFRLSSATDLVSLSQAAHARPRSSARMVGGL